MDGIAAKVAQEIGVLLEHEHIYARACQQEPQHHPRRTASGNATPGVKGLVHGPYAALRRLVLAEGPGCLPPLSLFAAFRLRFSASIRSITGALRGCLTAVTCSPFCFWSISLSTFCR